MSNEWGRGFPGGPQSELMYKEFLPVFGLFKAFYVGLMIQLIILGLGGPTGVAINPARDLSPRIAHQLLPISGKVLPLFPLFPSPSWTFEISVRAPYALLQVH